MAENTRFNWRLPMRASGGELIEIQGTAEGHPFTFAELEQMLALARTGIESLFAIQTAALSFQRPD